jgi:phenylacetate-coenzyme A ligase PaaK-like adenylate-forming protein
MTTGTTGQSTTTLFTNRETQIFALMSALSMLRQGLISKADIVQVSTSARALLGNQTFMEACRYSGALVYQTGVVDVSQTLAQLAQHHKLPGRKSRVSVLFTYPSYLGQLLEKGVGAGYGPQDFGLERIIVSGEVNSPGLRQRSEALFGPVTFDEGYGISEVWPFGGAYCEAGHLHFDPLRGLMEVIDPDTGRPALPGEAGSLVLTPFLPFRESAIILRYDTGDMVRTLDEPCTCSLSFRPATSPLMGKKRFCVHTDNGWFGPRDILELLEPNLEVPLPVRLGLWATADGLCLEVVAAREAKTTLHDEISGQLQSAGIPVTALRLVTDPTQLERPLPWRADLHEHSFSE